MLRPLRPRHQSLDRQQLQARVAWAASANPALARYEVRGVAGPDYDAELEEVVGSIDPEAPRELLTDFALTQSGAVASFKVYVILTTGNEAGSEAMTRERVPNPGPREGRGARV